MNSKKTRWILLALSLILVLASLLMSCATQKPVPVPAPGPTPGQPQPGGTLKIIIPTPPSNLGDQPIGAFDFRSVIPSVESLFRYEMDYTPKPNLAKTWQISPDGKSITVNLVEGVKFHDGTDFNATAVKYNLDRQIAAKKATLQALISVDVISTYTVRLNLSQYDSTIFFRLGNWDGTIVSPASMEKGKDWAVKNPVGTGPFKLASYEPNVSLKFTKFDGYWQKGKPYLDAIEIIYIKDPMTQLASFKAGEANVYFGSASVNPQSAAELETLKYGITKFPGVIFGLIPPSATPDSPFADKRVREAVEYAIDRSAIVKALGYGFWVAMDQAAITGSSAYNSNIKPRSYDPAKAKQLLKESGYPDGFETRIIGRTLDWNADVAVIMQKYLLDVGIKVKLEPVTEGQWSDIRYKQGAWKDGLIFYGVMAASGNYASNASLDLPIATSSWPVWQRPPGWGDKLQAALSELDFGRLNEKCKDLVTLTFNETAWMPIYTVTSYVAKLKVNDDAMLKVHVFNWEPANVWLSK